MREMNASALVMRHNWDKDVATVAVCGEIDVTTVSVLSEYLDRLVIRNPKRLIIDLANVPAWAPRPPAQGTGTTATT